MRDTYQKMYAGIGHSPRPLKGKYYKKQQHWLNPQLPFVSQGEEVKESFPIGTQTAKKKKKTAEVLTLLYSIQNQK